MKDATGRTLTPWNCKKCGDVFYARRYDIRNRNRQWCSRKCAQSGENNGNYKGGTTGTAYTRTSIERYPEKHQARRLFVNAVRRGYIERKPCCVCGEAKADGHHWDYAKPYDVFWLCRQCHSDVHQGTVVLHLPGVPIIPAV